MSDIDRQSLESFVVGNVGPERLEALLAEFNIFEAPSNAMRAASLRFLSPYCLPDPQRKIS